MLGTSPQYGIWLPIFVGNLDGGIEFDVLVVHSVLEPTFFVKALLEKVNLEADQQQFVILSDVLKGLSMPEFVTKGPGNTSSSIDDSLFDDNSYLDVWDSKLSIEQVSAQCERAQRKGRAQRWGGGLPPSTTKAIPHLKKFQKYYFWLTIIHSFARPQVWKIKQTLSWEIVSTNLQEDSEQKAKKIKQLVINRDDATISLDERMKSFSLYKRQQDLKPNWQVSERSGGGGIEEDEHTSHY